MGKSQAQCWLQFVLKVLEHTQGRIKASAGPGAVPKMRQPPPMGTHFFVFHHAYCVYQNSSLSISVAAQYLKPASFHKLYIKNYT